MIHILSETLRDQIAAGEVVERPASVVKELIENAIDAGATKVEVEVQDGGKSLIKVSDNGMGMSKEDAQMAVQRFATSKIAMQEDLWHLHSYGFRGEALASIASVSYFQIATAQKDTQSGIRLTVRDGQILHNVTIPPKQGTYIRVEHLFSGVPARLKFLKASSTENKYIAQVLRDFALAHPEVSLRLVSDTKEIYNFPKNQSLQERFATVLPSSEANELFEISAQMDLYHIFGYVVSPKYASSVRRNQYLFVQDRPVSDNMLGKAVRDGLKSKLPHEAPNVPFVINIHTEPELVDVNVHPRKSEVRFVEWQRVFEMVKKAVSQSVDDFDGTRHLGTQDFSQMATAGYGRRLSPGSGYQGGGHVGLGTSAPFNTSGASLSQEKPEAMSDLFGNMPFEQSNREDFPVEKAPQFFQLSDKYLVRPMEDGLQIIDQHALHERYLYEKFMESYGNVDQTVLGMFPVQIELSDMEAEIILGRVQELSAFGVQAYVEGNTVQVSAFPKYMDAAAVKEMVYTLASLDAIIDDQSKEDKIATMACRAAVKFGQKLMPQEMAYIIDKESRLGNKSCPHWRPFVVSIWFDQLDKWFVRKK